MIRTIISNLLAVNWPVLFTGLAIVALLAFPIGVNLSWLNRPNLKFSADNELDISQVKFTYRNIVNEAAINR